MFVLFGHSSYLLTLFILITGIRLTLGIVKKYIVSKFLLLFVSIFLINITLYGLELNWYELGVISNIISQFFLNSIQVLTVNYYISFIIHFFTIIAGFLLLLFSFSIRIANLTKFKFVLRVIVVFKILKYFNVFRYLKRESVNKRPAKKKNEPTIRKLN